MAQEDLGTLNVTLPMSLSARHKLLAAAGTCTNDTTRVVEVMIYIRTPEVRNAVFRTEGGQLTGHLGVYFTLIPDTILLGYLLANWQDVMSNNASKTRRRPDHTGQDEVDDR